MISIIIGATSGIGQIRGKRARRAIALPPAFGFFYLVDRERDIIKNGGQRISAGEIDEALEECPTVVRALVVGATREILGEGILKVELRRLAQQILESSPSAQDREIVFVE